MATPLGSGLGAFGAGVGPCGHDPEDELVGSHRQETVEALEFDPYDRVYSQNADGSMVAGSGPIQRAAHLMLPLGSIAATPESGLDVDAIKRASPGARKNVIEDALRRTWKVLIETNQIRMGTVTVVRPGPPWKGEFTVDVVDLVTKKPETLRGKVN